MAHIGDILELRREPITIEANREYRRIGIYSWGKGFLHRPPAPGSEMGSLRYFTFPHGALVLSNIQAWEAAVAVSGTAERGHVASNRFLPYIPRDDNKVCVDYLLHYFLSEDGLAALRRASPGTQVRNRTLGQRLFEDIEIPLPRIADQNRIADHLAQFDCISRQVVSGDVDHEERAGALIEGAVQATSTSTDFSVQSLLERDRNWFEPDADEMYSSIGIRGFGRGIVHYPEVARSELPKLRFYHVFPQRLLVSNIKAWEGAVAVTTEADQSRIASNRFLQYRLISDVTSLEWIRTYLLSRSGNAQPQKASPGSADRNRTLSMEAFESIRIPVPPVEQQAAVLALVNAATAVGVARRRRLVLADAILPSARNEVFSSLR